MQTHAGCAPALSVSMNPCKPSLVNSVGLCSPGVLIPSDSYDLFPFLPLVPQAQRGGPNGDLQFKLSRGIMSGCGSLNPLPFGAGGSLSDDDRIGTDSWSLGGVVASSCVSKQCQTWGLFPGTGLKLSQTLVFHSHKFRATIAPAHLAGKGDCRSKVVWLG